MRGLEPELGELERPYREHFLKADTLQAAVAIGLTGAIMPVFGIADYFFFGVGPTLWFFMAARVVFTLTSLVVVRALLRTRTPGRFDRLVFAWSMMMTLMMVALDASRPPTDGTHLVFDVLLIVAMHAVVASQAFWRLAPPLCLSALVLGIEWWMPSGQGALPLLSVTAAVTLANLVGLFMSMRMSASRRLQFQALIQSQRARRSLEQAAHTDALTRTLNRRRFYELAEVEFSRFRRYGRAFSVLMMDLDHFKGVNDRHGHRTGDEALKRFAGVLMACKRDTDLLARVGGEEFCLLLPETGEEAAGILAERIRAAVEALEIPIEGGALRITTSVGVAEATREDGGIDDLLERADRALYAAKHAGRNCVLRASSVAVDVHRRTVHPQEVTLPGDAGDVLGRLDSLDLAEPDSSDVDGFLL